MVAKPHHVKSGQATPNQVKSGQVTPIQVKPSQGATWWAEGQGKPSQSSSAQFKPQAMPCQVESGRLTGAEKGEGCGESLVEGVEGGLKAAGLDNRVGGGGESLVEGVEGGLKAAGLDAYRKQRSQRQRGPRTAREP